MDGTLRRTLRERASGRNRGFDHCARPSGNRIGASEGAVSTSAGHGHRCRAPEGTDRLPGVRLLEQKARETRISDSDIRLGYQFSPAMQTDCTHSYSVSCPHIVSRRAPASGRHRGFLTAALDQRVWPLSNILRSSCACA